MRQDGGLVVVGKENQYLLMLLGKGGPVRASSSSKCPEHNPTVVFKH